jgi:radical SAM superfamily enzyme YgiQ (UPF0313 family)
MAYTTLLLALNSQFFHTNPAVHSLKGYSEHYSRKLGVDIGRISIREMSINDTDDAILHEILLLSPDFIAFSVYIWNVSRVSRLAKSLRLILPGSKIILGGPEVSFGPEHAGIEERDYDYLITGEGERAFFSLISELCASPVKSPYTLYRRDKSVWSDKIDDLSEIPFIYSSENIGLFENRIIYYESSRGCPFNCSFCLSGSDRDLRFLPLERVKSEIDFFLDAGVKQVKFVDRTFNCIPARANEIIAYIVGRGEAADTNFHFEIGADLITREQLDLFGRAKPGLIQLEAGIQSTNPETLNACHRKTDLDKCFKSVSEIVKTGNINIHVDLIAGLPLESYDGFSRSFNSAYALNAHQLQLGFLKLLKGSAISENANEHGYVFSGFPPYEVICNKYMDYRQVMRLKCIEDTLERYYNSGRFRQSLDCLLGFFDTPFAMYEKLAAHLEAGGHIFKPVSSRRNYDILYSFALPFLLSEDEKHEFKRRLLIDYYSTDRSDVLPECLQDMRRPYNSYKEEAAALLAKNGLSGKNGVEVRYVPGGLMVFDYSARNPVTLQYSRLLPIRVKNIDEPLGA